MRSAKKQGGFTLIEMVLMIFLVATTITALYFLLASLVKSGTENRYEIIASNLAQEGIEIIRNIRDENAMRMVQDESVLIDDGIDARCYPNVSDSSGSSISVDCNSSGLPNLENVDGFYQQASDDDEKTIFYRECRKENVSAENDSFQVVCEVCWKSFVGAGADGLSESGCKIDSLSGQSLRSVKARVVLSNWM